MAKFVADLHLHSAYARATSKNLNFDTLSEWAKLKGIQLLSSADFTHPLWWQETKAKLKESKYDGFYYYNRFSRDGSPAGREAAYFLLGSEISSIYSQGGRVRRTHCLLYFPQMSDVDKFNSELGKKANLRSDGRPIVGLSAKQLLELALSINEDMLFIPAHAWTPWFSLYGSNSGFDSIDECFGDLAKYIYAIETGLSSDPAMNWRIKELDNRSIVSFSDAHSAPKMGREATIFETDFNYQKLLKALKMADRNSKIAYTIEFFPEEGKYHFTGHRNCGVSISPQETIKRGIVCPKCGRKLTIGVMHRIDQLAEQKRPEDFVAKKRPEFKRLVPLLEILAESLNSQVNSQKVLNEYNRLIEYFGSELAILLKARVEEITKVANIARIAEGIEKVREGNIVVEPGYDGLYGVVKIWPQETTLPKPLVKKETQIRLPDGQVGLFDQ